MFKSTRPWFISGIFFYQTDDSAPDILKIYRDKNSFRKNPRTPNLLIKKLKKTRSLCIRPERKLLSEEVRYCDHGEREQHFKLHEQHKYLSNYSAMLSAMFIVFFEYFEIYFH